MILFFCLASYSSETNTNLNMITPERVSIDYEKLTDLLKCGNCSNLYDRCDRVPKLLTCLHDVCSSCIEAICTQLSVSQSNAFSCPKCHAEMVIPSEGPSSFKSAPLMIQLLDLVDSQCKDIIPKCSNHTNQEMLFCESCGEVFCDVCSVGSHDTIGHNVSIAPRWTQLF